MEIKDMTLIIAIDPGKSGAISSGYFNELTHGFNMVRTAVMPPDVVEINKYIGYLIEGHDINKVFVFIENILVFKSDSKDGKMFNMKKLHDNFNQLKTIFSLRGIRVELVMPATWQKQLQLRKKGVKEESKVRKNRYKEFAQATFPVLKVNLKNGDSLCILEWSRRQLIYNPKKYING